MNDYDALGLGITNVGKLLDVVFKNDVAAVGAEWIYPGENLHQG